MTPDQIVSEFRKGCSNTLGGEPMDCDDCVDAAVRALATHGIQRAEAIGMLRSSDASQIASAMRILSSAGISLQIGSDSGEIPTHWVRMSHNGRPVIFSPNDGRENWGVTFDMFEGE